MFSPVHIPNGANTGCILIRLHTRQNSLQYNTIQHTHACISRETSFFSRHVHTMTCNQSESNLQRLSFSPEKKNIGFALYFGRSAVHCMRTETNDRFSDKIADILSQATLTCSGGIMLIQAIQKLSLSSPVPPRQLPPPLPPNLCMMPHTISVCMGTCVCTRVCVCAREFVYLCTHSCASENTHTQTPSPLSFTWTHRFCMHMHRCVRV